MCQNIDKQQNMSLGFYNSFQDNAPIFIRGKKTLWIHLYAGFGGLQSAVKGLSRNFLVPRSGINGAARPQGAESTLGPGPRLRPLHQPACLPAAGQEDRLLPEVSYPGWALPERHFWGARAQKAREARDPGVQQRPPGAGRAAGPGAPGVLGTGGGAGVSVPEVAAARPTRVTAAGGAPRLTATRGDPGVGGKRGRQRPRAPTQKKRNCPRARWVTATQRGRIRKQTRRKEKKKQMEGRERDKGNMWSRHSKL